MTVELRKGYYIDSYYDKDSKSYITSIKDKESNQVGEILYSDNMTDRNSDIQNLKEIFNDESRWKDFESSNNGNISSDLNNRKFLSSSFEEDESFEESLDSKIQETRRKTKKAKLPALSTLSPIMPDAAAGISNFNSGVGLSEDYIGRDELIKRLKDMGYKYNYPKYTDQELYEIYRKNLKAQETKKELKKLKEIEKLKKQRYKDKLSQVKYDEDSDTFSDGNYYKDGIEFESEDAAREYFGESMKYRTGKKINRDTLTRPTRKKSDLSKRAENILYDNGILQTVDDNMITDLGPKTTKKIDTILNDNGFKTQIDQRGDLYNIYLLESMDSKVYLNDMHKAWDIDESYNYELYDDLCSEYESLYPYDITLDQVYDEIMNNYNDEDLANDVIENLESYESENFYESKWNEHKKVLNENLKVKRNSVKHNFRTITEGLKYFERKEFNENYKDAELESLYEGIKNNLDQEDIKKLGNFLKKADSADDVATYIRGLLSEDIDNENFNSVTIGLYGGDETFSYPEDFYSFIDKCKRSGITVSNDSCDEYMNWEMDLTGNGYTIYKLCRDFPGYDNAEFSANDWIYQYRIDESLTEDTERYSDVVPYENRKYWYFTTHGVGPGTIPKDLHVLEIREGQNDRGTWGDFICLDGVLNTSELQKYDLRELAPTTNESLTESMTKEEVQTKKDIISYLNRDYPKVASLLNDFDFILTEDPDTVGYVDLNTKHVVLNRNLSMKNKITCILHPLRQKSFKQALKDPKFIQQMQDENKEIEKLLREKDGYLNEDYDDPEEGEAYESYYNALDMLDDLQDEYNNIKRGDKDSLVDFISNNMGFNTMKKIFGTDISPQLYSFKENALRAGIERWFKKDFLSDMFELDRPLLSKILKIHQAEYESLNEALKDTRIKSYDTQFGTFIIKTREGKSRRTNYMTGKKEWMPVKSTLGYFEDFPLAVEFFLYRDGQDRYVSSSQGRRSDEWVEFLNARDYDEALHITEREVVKCFQDYYEDSSIY